MTGVKDILVSERRRGGTNGIPRVDPVRSRTGRPQQHGRSEWDIVFDQVSQLQNRRLTPAMERAISLIYAQKSVKLDRVDDGKLCWNP